MSEGSLSAADLRQRRRQKILANSSSRMERILGGSSAPVEQENEDVDWNSLSRGPQDKFEEMEENGVTIIRRKVTNSPQQSLDNEEESETTTTKTSPSTATVTSKKVQFSMSGTATRRQLEQAQEEETATTNNTKINDTPLALGFMLPAADGSTTHPKLSLMACRVLLFLLGVFLSIFNAKYFLVTFFSWEVAVFLINGLPNEESPSSSFILLMALMGVKEKQIQWLKFILKLGNCILTDLSVLIVAAVVARVIFQNALAPYYVK